MAKRPATFPRNAQRKFLRELMAAETSADAIRVLRAKAAEFQPTTHIGWFEALHSVADGLETGRPRFNVITRQGNKKLPFAYFSSLAIFTCPGAGACAAFCYSLKAWQYPGAFARKIQNTLLLRFAPDAIETAFMAIPHDSTFRLYVDGDFDSARTVDFWFRLLNQRPDIRAYGYSKSWDLLANREFPANYWLNLSSGGRHQTTSADDLLRNPQTRGRFISVPTDYNETHGFARYKDRAYHLAVLESAKAQGIDRPFSCPGDCGKCTKLGPACGIPEFVGRNIVIGIH